MDKMTQEDRIKHYAHLIQRQTGKAVRPYRADGYVNMVNRYGTSKDSSEQYDFIPDAPVADDVLEMHYENNGLFSKIIDMPAEEAIKHGFTLEDVEDGKLADFYSEALDELNWEENAMTAVKWARLFGGSIAVMLVNDGRGLEEPLDWKNIQSIDDIRVYDRSLVHPDYSSVFNYDPQDPFRVRGSRLGMPEYYDVYSKYGSFRVHDSRCLVFQNGVLPENATNSIYQFWGIPEYIRLNKAIRDADIAHRSAPKLLERSVQPIYKMKDLAAELATEQGEDRILKRLQVIDTARGILNSLVIDADGEDYDFKTFQYNGITDVISASCNMLAALSNIPQIILFGQTISGMSSTDDTSMENYYNYVERIQKRMLRSNLRYLLSVVFQAGLATGEVDEVPKLKVQFNPLWSVSDSEQATLDQQKAQTEQVKAQTAQIYVGMEAIDPSEVRSKLADSDDFDVENMLDEYTEEELEAGMPSGEEEQPQAPVGQTATPDSQPTGNDEKAGPGQLLNEKTLSAVGNNAKDPATMETKVSSDPHENKEGTEGDEPASAPAATKKPSDMDPEEKAKAAQSRQNKAKDREGTLHTDDNNSHSEEQKGSVGVIVVNGGRVLNGTRHNDFGYGLVCGPGGHIEDGETPEQAAFRETKEEFGIMPESLMWLGQGPKEKDTGLQPYLFLCTEYSGTPNCEDLEMTGAKFSTLEELNEKAESMFGPFADGLKILMDCLETGIFYTDPAEGVTDEKLNAHLEKAMNADDDDWITVNGTHVMIDENGTAKNGGNLAGKNFSAAKSSRKKSAGSESSNASPNAVFKKTGYKPLYTQREKWALSSQQSAASYLDEKCGYDHDRCVNLIKSGKAIDEAKSNIDKNYAGVAERYQNASESQKKIMSMSIDELAKDQSKAWTVSIDPSLNASSGWQRFVALHNLNDKPQILDDDKFEKVAKQSEFGTLYRGVRDSFNVTADQIIQDTMYGDKTYIGQGGPDGFYTSTQEETARDYGHGNYMKLCLSPKANVIKEADLYKLASTEYIGLSPEVVAYSLGYNAVLRPDAPDGAWVENEHGEKQKDNHIIFLTREAMCFPKTQPRHDGGPGSGNHGHKGREGKVGGSAPGDSVAEQCGKMNQRISEIDDELVKCNEEMISKGMSPQLMERMQSLVSESQKIKSDLEISDPNSKTNVAKRLCEEGHPTEDQVINSLPKEWRESYDPSGEQTYGEEFSAKIGSWCGEGYKGLKNDKVIDKAIRTSSAKWKSGNLYRGLSVDGSQLSALKPGATIKMDGLSSWSSDISPAMSFATTEKDPVLIVDKTTGVRNALSIAQMSSRSWEKEVLYCSDQKFTIKSVTTRPVDYGESASGNAGDFSKQASRKVTVIEVEANSD